MNYNSGFENQQYGYINGFLLSLKPIIFNTDTLASTLSEHVTKIKQLGNNRMLPFNQAFKVEFAEDENIYDVGDERQIKIRTKGAFNKWHLATVPDSFKPYIKQLDGKDVYIIWLTSKGYLRGLEDKETGLKFISERVKCTITLVEATPTTEEYVTFNLQRFDAEDRMNIGKAIKPNFDLEDLKPLMPVELAQVGAATATGATVSVKTLIGTGVTGFVLADWVATDTTTFTAATDNGDGTYSMVGTGFSDATTFNLVAPASIADTSLYYESTGAVTIDVT